jgi:Na+:H+ antiporter, NhaA family
MLPLVAAIGGMAVPALIYLAIAGGVAPGGWGVPVATDIALAVGSANHARNQRCRIT